jgi:hypothetical protein
MMVLEKRNRLNFIVSEPQSIMELIAPNYIRWGRELILFDGGATQNQQYSV